MNKTLALAALAALLASSALAQPTVDRKQGSQQQQVGGYTVQQWEAGAPSQGPAGD